ncbi:MAG: hypothetical protein ACPG8W_03230 [Candidatus Promineifilaceae bacterium]
MRPTNPSSRLLFIPVLILLIGIQIDAEAQNGVDPTPIVIHLSPTAVVPTIAPTPVSDSPFVPDVLEPNNSAETATQINWQTLQQLTLIGNDTDYFVGFLRAGQSIQVETVVYGSLDTRLTFFWRGVISAENDNKSATDLGSRILFNAPEDGTFVFQVGKTTDADGHYDLHTLLIEPTPTQPHLPTHTPFPTATPWPTHTHAPTHTPPPTATPWPTHTPAPLPTATPWPTHTPAPTHTPPPTTTPWPTHTPLPTVTSWPTHTPTPVHTPPPQSTTATQKWPTPTPIVMASSTPIQSTASLPPLATVTTQSQGGARSVPTTAPILTATQSSFVTTPTITPTVSISSSVAITTPTSITATQALTLSIRHLGRIESPMVEASTHIRLLIHYDANNDRTPSPGEGIPNVSVLAVDARGQQLARVFTNAQGEAVFNMTSEAVARIVVPLVPSWSERIRVGEQNDNIVLGLPAVRLPVFLPVDMGEEN